MGGMSRIVCGWYTPDYGVWAAALRENLSNMGERHDIVCVPKAQGGWERNTMRKPQQLLDAMERHPDDIVIFLDVDCSVRHSLAPLADLHGDVALYFRSKINRNGVGRMSIRSGTIVIRSSEAALRFVRNWLEISREQPAGSVDQTTLPTAMALTPGLSVDVLGNEFCAVEADGVPNPTILHDSASKYRTKMPIWLRSVNRILNRRGAQPDPDGSARARG